MPSLETSLKTYDSLFGTTTSSSLLLLTSLELFSFIFLAIESPLLEDSLSLTIDFLEVFLGFTGVEPEFVDSKSSGQFCLLNELSTVLRGLASVFFF